MKHVYSIICLLLFVTTTSFAQKINNDLVRYGLKGKVKTMTQTIYAFSRKDGDKWIVTDTPFYNVKVYHFNDKGIVEKMEDTHVDNKTKKASTTVTKFIYKNGKIMGSQWYDTMGVKKGESNITWENDHKYIDIVDDNNMQLKIETIHLLDDNYRNIDVWMKRYSYNGLEGNMRTQFFYDNGSLSSQIMTDSVMGHTFNYQFEVIEKDNVGNSLESAMSIVPPNGMPAQLVFTKYEYYEK